MTNHAAIHEPEWEISQWPLVISLGILFHVPLAFAFQFVYHQQLSAVLCLGIGVPLIILGIDGVPFTKLQILLYTLLLVAVTLLPFITQMSGLLYLAGAIALGMGFLRYAIALYRSDSDNLAMKTFGYSIFYLNLLFAFLITDHYARVFLRAYVLN